MSNGIFDHKNKYSVLRNHDKELLDFIKKFLEDNYYVSAKKLSALYEGLSARETPSRKLSTSFGQILGNLCKLGILERYNTFTYRKTTNWLLELAENERIRKENAM